MAYILQKGEEYCFLDSRNKIRRTQDISLALRFTDIKKAYDLLHMARKKLDGFKVVDLDMDSGITEKGMTRHRAFSEGDRRAIYNRYKGRCAICGRFVPYDEFTIDHIIPLAKGGDNGADNLQCAHVWCNFIKRDALMEELTGKLMEIVLYQAKVKIGTSAKRAVDGLKGWLKDGLREKDETDLGIASYKASGDYLFVGRKK